MILIKLNLTINYEKSNHKNTNGKVKSIQKRSHERIPSCIVVKFSHSDSICYGIVKNISEKGMYINTGLCLPSDAKVTLRIPLKNIQLEVPVVVRWTNKTYEFY